jgi:hypothetical protein
MASSLQIVPQKRWLPACKGGALGGMMLVEFLMCDCINYISGWRIAFVLPVADSEILGVLRLYWMNIEIPRLMLGTTKPGIGSEMGRSDHRKGRTNACF